MTPERAKLLKELLEEIAEKENGYIPAEAWHSFHKVVSIPYCEVAVVTKHNSEWQILLGRVRPNDPDFPGDPWEIMGGMWKPHFKNQEEICMDIAQREMGVRIKNVQEIKTVKWLVARGNGISHICLAEIDEAGPKLFQHDRKKFFSFAELPRPLAPYHSEFLEICRTFLQSGAYSAGDDM